MACARTASTPSSSRTIRNASARSSPTGSPPGPSPRRRSARCSEPIIGRHGRWTGPVERVGVDDDAHLAFALAAGPGLTGAETGPTGASMLDRLATA